MTFHDDVHRDFEAEALKAKETLFDWLGTIAPLSGTFAVEFMGALQRLAQQMQWPDQPVPGAQPNDH